MSSTRTSNLKLGKLPNRAPVKLTITVNPNLVQALREYAAVYRAAYGESESIADLIPFMLDAFLQSDKSFAKARKELPLEGPTTSKERHRPRGSSSPSRSTPREEN